MNTYHRSWRQRLERKKHVSRMKLEKKTHGFRSQELGGMRTEDLKKLHLDEKKENKGREWKC